MYNILLKASAFIFIIFLGYFLKKKGFFTQTDSKFVNKTVINKKILLLYVRKDPKATSCNTPDPCYFVINLRKQNHHHHHLILLCCLSYHSLSECLFHSPSEYYFHFLRFHLFLLRY